MVHVCLKCGGGIGEAERDHGEFIVAMMCSKCRLLDVFLSYPNMVVACSQIELGEDTHAV